MPKSDMPRIAILGAGPVGLEAGLYARTLNFPVAIFDRGQAGEYWQRWGHVRLFSPFAMNSTSLGRAAIKHSQLEHDLPADDAIITGREHHEAYLIPLSKVDALRGCIHVESQVVGVSRQGLLKEDHPGDPARAKKPFRILIREAKGRERIEEADVVLDCTGTYGQHRWLGDGGIPAIGEQAAEAQIAYTLEDVLGEKHKHYAGKNILVVGSGYSAATTVCNLAALAEKNPATWVIWLARAAVTQPIRRIPNDPLRERDRLAVRANNLATRTDGNVEFHAQCAVQQIEFQGHERGFRVQGTCAGRAKTWEVEQIIGNVGYSPDRMLYRELQVHECYASLGPMKLAASLLGQKTEDCLNVTLPGPDALRNPEPNFFVLGAKSFGRNSNFLLRTGFSQIRDVFTLITGNKNLDLYKRP
jgi:thioredoxin reductase